MAIDLNAICGELSLTRLLTADAIAQAQMDARNDKAVIEKIRNFLAHAMRHAALQSDEFYSALKSHHRSNSSALKIIDFFEADLRELRLKLFIFGEEYFADKRVKNIRIFVSVFMELSRVVLSRIDVEDSQLVPLLAPFGKVRCQQN